MDIDEEFMVSLKSLLDAEMIQIISKMKKIASEYNCGQIGREYNEVVGVKNRCVALLNEYSDCVKNMNQISPYFKNQSEKNK